MRVSRRSQAPQPEDVSPEERELLVGRHPDQITAYFGGWDEAYHKALLLLPAAEQAKAREVAGHCPHEIISFLALRIRHPR